MAANNVKNCLTFTLKFEGGFVNDPKDPGGATNFGITIFTLADFRKKKVTVKDVQNLTLKEAGEIYKLRFWDKVRGDDLPVGIDCAVFDFGVHSGPTRSAKVLQRVLGLEDDGAIGDITLKAVRAAEPVALIKSFAAARLTFLQSLPVFQSFPKGLTNRANLAEAAALSMLA